LLKVCRFHIENLVTLKPGDKCLEIMRNKNSSVITALGKFIYISMLKRSKSDLTVPRKRNSKNKKTPVACIL
jgi:hypothetical protein